MLNGQELIDRKVITGPIEPENIAQHGVDLNVIEISQVYGGGIIPAEGKTQLGKSEKVAFNFDKSTKRNWWYLQPGVYSVVFKQGCNIPADMMTLIRQRSSLLRNGTILHSSVFDAGFKTDKMGTVMIVNAPIAIEYGARIGQMYGHACTPVAEENLYNGQWQGDKQREIPTVDVEQTQEG